MKVCVARVEGIKQPRPCDVGQERIRANFGLERGLRETHNPPCAVPCPRLVSIVQQDEASRAVLGVDAFSIGADVAGKRDRVGRQAAGRRNLTHRKVFTKGEGAQRIGNSSEGWGC